jgi:hypothetical protein
MPPRRKAGNERSELMAVLTCLITMYVAHGVPPSIPELVASGHTEKHAIFERPGRDGATPWGIELRRALMAASAQARELNGEEALSEATFLLKLLGGLKKRAPAGDAAAFRILAVEFELQVPEVRATRRNDCGGKDRAASLSENAPVQSPSRPARGKGPASPLGSLQSAPTQAVAATRTRGACERGALQAAALPCLHEMGQAGLAELGAELSSEQVAAMVTGHTATEGRAAALVTALAVPARVQLAETTLADPATLAAMVKGYGGDTQEARLAAQNLAVARAAVEGLSQSDQLNVLDVLGAQLMGKVGTARARARARPCSDTDPHSRRHPSSPATPPPSASASTRSSASTTSRMATA